MIFFDWFQGSLETKEFILDEVAKGLNLNPNRFCVLAALLGNFLLTDADLREFHKRICEENQTLLVNFVFSPKFTDLSNCRLNLESAGRNYSCRGDIRPRFALRRQFGECRSQSVQFDQRRSSQPFQTSCSLFFQWYTDRVRSA